MIKIYFWFTEVKLRNKFLYTLILKKFEQFKIQQKCKYKFKLGHHEQCE